MANTLILLLLALGASQAQQKTAQKPQPAKPPSVNCPEAQTSKACHSFKQLLDAQDKDILHSLSLPPSYVCFRPGEDAFLIVNVEEPRPYGWKKLDDNGVEEQQFKSSVKLTEYKEGVFNSIKNGREVWRRSSPDDEPLFYSEATEGLFKGLKIVVDEAEITIDYPFNNQNGGTTQYSLTIRRSTGRFIEAFTSEITHTTTQSGSCLIYR